MKAHNKRIIVLSDGTWNDPEDDNATNVLRMARAVKPVDSEGFKQVVFYDWGVGSYYQSALGGGVGLGIQKNVQDGYRFIVQNYNPGDEVWLFGFSRGAYTARCLAGFLNKCGILKRTQANEIPAAFHFYKQRKTKPSDPAASRWRRAHCHSSGRGTVDFLGVWDTVGALGVPTRVLAFVDEKDLFYDHDLGSNVQVARHAVAIDERRADFKPTLWTKKDAVDVKQVWFAGVHSDIGGGYAPDDGGHLLSDIPLAWMAREASACGIEFERHLYSASALRVQADMHRSYRSFWRALGKETRVLPTDATLHQSVQQRFQRTDYRPKQLMEWLDVRNGKWGDLEAN
ncbi:MAG: DUF2235 domain-containing protein [Pseudomonadota bacterium]